MEDCFRRREKTKTNRFNSILRFPISTAASNDKKKGGKLGENRYFTAENLISDFQTVPFGKKMLIY